VARCISKCDLGCAHRPRPDQQGILEQWKISETLGILSRKPEKLPTPRGGSNQRRPTYARVDTVEGCRSPAQELHFSYKERPSQLQYMIKISYELNSLILPVIPLWFFESTKHCSYYVMKLASLLTATAQLALVVATPVPLTTSDERDTAVIEGKVEPQIARAPIGDLIATHELEKRAPFIFSAACVSNGR
jgi:hypothetical protein